MIRRALFILLFLSSVSIRAAEVVYPGKTWQQVTPAEAGLDAEKLREYAAKVEGDGCVIRNGRMAYHWGDLAVTREWASAGKPVLGTLLLLAAQNGLVPSVHMPLVQAGWPLQGKDRTMTFKHLANMTGGYARGEVPGAAWAYNDFGVQLFAKALARRFGEPLDQAARRCLAPLQFEDGSCFASPGGLKATLSMRDMARLGWLWLNEGRWNDTKLMSNRLYTKNVRPEVPAGLPVSHVEGTDYLDVGSYGGSGNQTPHGPGIYGFYFWFNTKLPDGSQLWPAAPQDTYQANGHWNWYTVTLFPSLKMVVVLNGSKRLSKFVPSAGTAGSNKAMQLLMDAVVKGRPKRW